MSVSEKENPYPPAVQMFTDIAYKKEALEYVKEQRALLDIQKKYSKWTLIFSFTIMVATVVYAIFAVLQYLKM